MSRERRQPYAGSWLLLLTTGLLLTSAGRGVMKAPGGDPRGRVVTSAGRVLMKAQAADRRGRTVWDGVYTDAQAARATSTFNQACSNCHTLSPQGNRPVTGDKFWETFTQKTVGDLLTYVKTNMPNGNGGSLSAPTYNELVALILKSNGFPAGTTELAPETIADVQII